MDETMWQSWSPQCGISRSARSVMSSRRGTESIDVIEKGKNKMLSTERYCKEN